MPPTRDTALLLDLLHALRYPQRRARVEACIAAALKSVEEDCLIHWRKTDALDPEGENVDYWAMTREGRELIKAHKL